MATYREIQKFVKRKYGYTVKTCWIADVKEMCGLNPKKAPNRLNISCRENPCPLNKIDSIKDAFKHFSMI